MITAGIDCGAKNVRAVILKDGEVVGKAMKPAGLDASVTAETVYDAALAAAGLERDDVKKVVSTGTGKNEPRFKNETVTEVGADARGMHHLNPEVRTVIDVGAEEGRAIRISDNGRVVDFAINDKCAAGTGAFTEAMARALEVPIEEIGELSLKSTQAIPINAQCAVFAESELISLVHRQIPKPDMARSIHDAIADRITSMARRVGLEEKVAAVGGVSLNVGFVKSLKDKLKLEILLVKDPEYTCAIGAALVATDN
ncbi:MAG: CoA activase [Proteobacteria bacterium]|nr:CoA activase [Pseudomonadota bacterium]